MTTARAGSAGSAPWSAGGPLRSAAWIPIAVATGLGIGLVATLSPSLAVGVVVVAGLVAGVMAYPPLAAYVLIVTTPLIAGVDRDSLLPVLRPNEAILVLVAAALCARGLLRVLAGAAIRLRINRMDVCLILMSLTSSVVPLLWVVTRGDSVTLDDLLYALTLWKYYGVYLVVRLSIRSVEQVRTCLYLSMGAGVVVGVIAIMQSLELFGVPQLLATYFAPFQDEAALEINRGTSTLASSFAVGDVMAFNLAIALGWLLRGHKSRRLLYGFLITFILGVGASGQFSGAIGMVVGLCVVGLVTGQLRTTSLLAFPVVIATGVALQPVISRRLGGFGSLEGLPTSWTGRLENLQDFFWPVLFSDFNYVLGVRPDPVIPAPESWRDYVFIESGHTWLLWTGGIPFFAAFFFFLWSGLRATLSVARRRTDAIGVAAIASFASLAIVGVLMTFDPHLTLRGAADLLFTLLALALVEPVSRGTDGKGDAWAPT